MKGGKRARRLFGRKPVVIDVSGTSPSSFSFTPHPTHSLPSSPFPSSTNAKCFSTRQSATALEHLLHIGYGRVGFRAISRQSPSSSTFFLSFFLSFFLARCLNGLPRCSVSAFEPLAVISSLSLSRWASSQ